MPAKGDEASLRVRTTDRADNEIFDRFFAGYDSAFVLPDEKEDREGLAECLSLNHGARHAELEERFGSFRELCLIAETSDGAAVGGANFIAMPGSGDGGIVTANLNYIYVAPDARKRGNLRRLLKIVFEAAKSLFNADLGELQPLVFIEQNDPFQMSEENYERDTRFTGIDQLDRLRIWTRLGARVVDFPYVQPALSGDQEPDDSLIYSVLGSSQSTLSAAVLRGHLERFFGISVVKGRSLVSDRAARPQLDALKAAVNGGRAIDLLDPAPLLAKLGHRRDAAVLLGRRPTSFRDAVSEFRENLASPSA
jgi:GNAT superfamily N-acetyltransferase